MAARKYRFERLTPIDNMDLNVYEEAIDYVFSNSDVKNVAISGAYSAGKSSVLASYKKKHGELRFLHISLAHFKSTDQESDAEVKESTLEGKILNQLIHQIPSEKIPQTNFRVKKTVSSKSIATSTIGAVLFLISILHLLFFSVWKNYISVLPVSLIKSILMPSTHPYALIVDGIIILVLLSLSVHKLIRIQREKNIFRKLNIKGNEIEIFEKSDDSYFDKYLNEVLYLFENADADVIVFEDMDRFNTNGIFERLREVNTLANIQLNKKNEKVLRFFYLLRDDIFDSKDRTKFFDYIIPVVPVVDGSNSYDQFISQLKSAGTFEKFDKSFLQGLSLYIDDMRLLKNIYNEFVIYYNRLNITELDCNKMLAIIAYKNLFPRDFADLQLNQGFVYTLFSKKGKFVENEVSEIEREIEEIRNKISSYKNEHLMCQLAVLKFQQFDGLNTVLPIGTRRINAFRTLTTESLAVFMPFKVQEVQDKGGIYFGENAISHNLIMCNKANLLNQSAFLLGVPGSGKSFSAKELIAFLILDTTDDVLICDPENEFGALAAALGKETATVIHMAAGGKDRLNAMYMVDGYGENNPIVEKSQFIMSLVEQIDKAGVGPQQKSIIDRCTALVYQDAERTGKPAALCDLRNKLLEQPEEKAKEIALSLELFTTGSLDIFGHESTVDLDKRIVVFDIHGLGEQLKPTGLLVITDTILNRVILNWKKGKRTHIFIDEFHVVFENEQSGIFFNSAWRQFRKRNGYPTAITQNVEYLLDSVQASTMLSNSEFVVMLNQAFSDRAKLSKLLNISDEQMSYVTNADAGCGLIKYGSALVPFINRFPKDTELYRLMTTRPGEGVFGSGNAS